jgi:hypothetical protein
MYVNLLIIAFLVVLFRDCLQLLYMANAVRFLSVLAMVV